MPNWAEGIINGIGTGIEGLWSFVTLGLAPPLAAPTAIEISKPYTGIPTGQGTPAIASEDARDPVDLLPVIVGTIIAVFFVVRK